MMAVPCWPSWKHGDLHPREEGLLDLEASGRLDVFQINRAEGRFQASHRLDEFLGVIFGDLDIEDIDVGEFLEEDGLAFHDGFGGERADGAQSQDGGAVADDGDEVAAGGEPGGLLGVLDDGLAGGGHARGVGERQIALSSERFGGDDGQLAWPGLTVILQRGLFKIFWHGVLLGQVVIV